MKSGIVRFIGSIAPKGWIALGVVALLTAVVLISDDREERLVKTAKDSGAVDAVIAG